MKIKFYRCNICGNIVALINDGGGPLVCCGSDMELLVENTVDAAFEKHVPFVQEENDKIIVRVGEVDHPMIAEHYIQWIAFVDDKNCNIKFLKPGEEPKVEFSLAKNYTIYEYCNLHGLWKK